MAFFFNKHIFQIMEFHIHKDIKQTISLNDNSLFESTHNSVSDIHHFVHAFNQALEKNYFGDYKNTTPYLSSGIFNGIYILDKIFQYVCQIYIEQVDHNFLEEAYDYINTTLQSKTGTTNPLFDLLVVFCNNFPPSDVYNGKKNATEWLNKKEQESGINNTIIALKELLLLRIINNNTAIEPFSILFNENNLRKVNTYSTFWKTFIKFSKLKPNFGPENTDLISMLKTPAEIVPLSIKGQLQYIIQNWGNFLGDLLPVLMGGLDLIAEEEKCLWVAGPPQEQRIYHFDNIFDEYEKFSDDKDWMPNVVLIAKSTLVWLNQLSKKYNSNIERLDQIPNEELELLSSYGFNALWLIGVWERSKASARIKQLCGNPEAAASAYSLDSYTIAEDLGGWQALDNLKTRAQIYGIKLAADMVPNHTGMDSKWITDSPDLFMQVNESPFPTYTFSSENLSHNSRISIYLEDHYYSKQDCAVVFKRVDNQTGSTTYIYHGNDGTGLPWNDTAQLDFLNPKTREAVITEILNVAKNFSIIRLDAAMVLAKKNIQRLWYPEPGKGGDISSRSRFSMTNEEFNQKIPQEFWRELVDRCTKELPETLLLAEAFWMMEGYFVRTLGMHRVYNSAFMNMLKNEDNDKYRATIKNTIEFDKEILKRYVNFMNNPDEDTAIAQFGTGDKYFGICTMMIAMPGLPMFGHGQIEGYEEKYGMEYKKAYYNEIPSEILLNRHKKEIFPLLKIRHIFSGVENFFLFDFWNNNLINENVFAWSNYYNGQRSLIFYNNTYEQAFGWIQWSCVYAIKPENDNKQIEQKTFLKALQLKEDPSFFTIFYEQRSNQWFIRNNGELSSKGFYASLNGFETQVFLNIYEVEDTEDKLYALLCDKLNGRGIKDIDIGLKEIIFGELYKSITDIYSDQFFESIIECINKDFKNLNPVLDNFNIPITNFLNTSIKTKKQINPQNCNISAKSIEYTPNIEELITLFKNRLIRLIQLGENLKANKQVSSLYDKIFNSRNTHCNILILMLYSIMDLVSSEKSYDDGVSLILYFGVNNKLIDIMSRFNINDDECKEILTLHMNLLTIKKNSYLGVFSIVKEMLTTENFREYLKINIWNEIEWFNKERAEKTALAYLIIAIVCNFEYDIQHEYTNKVINIYNGLLRSIEQSEYKTQSLLDILKNI